MKKLLLILFAATSFIGFSQELETILLAREDAEKLTGAYVQPGTKALIYNMNNGWYHTAKVHKKFGFDITVSASGSVIPEKEHIFNIADVGLSSSTTANQPTTPTLGADNNVNPATITYTGTVSGQSVSVNFDMPTGINDDLIAGTVPTPMVQVGLGLPFKLEAIARFIPKIGTDDFKAGLFGIGLKKEITNWFGPLDKTPLHVSLLAAYTNMNADYEIGNISGDVTAQDATAEFNLNAYTFQALASLNFPVVNIFGGVGYNSGNSDFNMLGDYTLTFNRGTPQEVQETVSNPLSISSDAGSFNATVGVRLSLGFFKLFGSYSAQEYSSFNAGFAFSFR
jgi:hypothetical protein